MYTRKKLLEYVPEDFTDEKGFHHGDLAVLLRLSLSNIFETDERKENYDFVMNSKKSIKVWNNHFTDRENLQ